jgi:hypothetical protein
MELTKEASSKEERDAIMEEIQARANHRTVKGHDPNVDPYERFALRDSADALEGVKGIVPKYVLPQEPFEQKDNIGEKIFGKKLDLNL